MRSLGYAASVALCATLASGPAAGCFMESGPAGSLAVNDPATVPVLVATRSYVERKALHDISALPSQVEIELFELVHASGEHLHEMALDSVSDGPAYTTLFVRTALWMDFNTGGKSSRFHIDTPPAEDATVIVIDEPTLIAVLAGSMTLSEARQANLVVARGPDANESIVHFANLLRNFKASSVGIRITRELIKTATR
ncbi:MAG: hypothetical protein QNJ00_12130 [Woeseiaceae bacterium]|nr:hypothetical protein [Woeseiaceae bacterium]